MALLEIGTIAKAHGLRGEIVVDLISDRPERVAKGARWWVDGTWYTVRDARAHAGRWIVSLDGITSREDADVHRGARIECEPIDDGDALWVHDLVGARVVDTHGRERGTVVAVVDNPAGALLELDTDVLVPVRFVVDSSDLPERVAVDVPDGLFDLARAES